MAWEAEDTDFYGDPGAQGDSDAAAFTIGQRPLESAQGYAGDYQMGSRATTAKDRGLFGESAMRADQTGLERLMEQRSDYFYGGYDGGADDAIAGSRERIGKYTNALGGYGSEFMTEAGAAQGRQATGLETGMTGVYGTADMLNAYAQQGPGASVAQYQHEGNVAQMLGEHQANAAALQGQHTAQTNAGLRQQMMMAGSGRGAGGGAQAFRQAGMNQATMQGAANAQATSLQAQSDAQLAGLMGQANAQTGMLTAQQEQDWRQAQIAAMQGAGGLYGAGGQISLEQAKQNDAYQLGMGGLASQAQRDAGMMQLGGENLSHSINMGALQGSMGYEELLNSAYGIDKGIGVQQQGINQQQEAADKQFYGTLLASVSDIRAKKNIEPAGDEVTDTLRRLGVSQGEAQSAAGSRSQQVASRVPNLAEQFSLETGLGTPIEFDASSGIYREGDPLRSRGRTAGAYHPQAADPFAQRNIPDADIDPRTAEFDARGTTSSQFEYKDPQRHGEGSYVGPMAQELEHVPGVVKETPDGTKQIDPARLSLFNTSGLGEVQRETDDLDSRIANIEGMLGPEHDREAVNLDAAPKHAAVSKALHAFGDQAPSDEEISEAGSALRAKFGAAAGDEFEDYATGYRRQLSAPRPVPKLDYEFGPNEEAGPGGGVDFAFGPNEEDAPPKVDYAFGPNEPEEFDPDVAPAPAVDRALKAFGQVAPNDEEVDLAAEALRKKHGEAAAAQFKQYATAYRGDR